MESNRVSVIGRLHGDLKAFHSAADVEMLYDGTIVVQRLSGTMDFLHFLIPATVATRCGYTNPSDFMAHPLRMMGSIQTYSRLVDGKKRHYIILKVDHVEDALGSRDDNRVTLVGKISRPPVYRETPFGREVCEFMVAVERSRRRNDYIPCIAWGDNARYVGAMEEGQIVELAGRFQSREYVKTLENGEKETRTAYEVSAKTVCTHEVEKRLITEPEKEK